MPPLRRLLSCKSINDDHFTTKGEGMVDMDNDPYETMESLKVSEIDDYLEAVLSRYNKRENKYTSGINFMESPRSSTNF